MKTKLAIVVPSLQGGGAERVITNIIRKINKDKFNLQIIMIKKEGAYLNYIPEHISIVDLGSDRARNSIFRLIKELNKYKPDVIFSTLGHLNLVLLSIKSFLVGKPKVIVREANTPSEILRRLSKSKKSFFSYLYRKLYPKADLIIAQCKDMKDDIISGFNIEECKVHYIYNPIDIEYIRSSITTINPYDKSKVNLLAVGRLAPQKGFDTLIKAIKVIANEVPNVQLTILGSGKLENELIDLARELGIADKVRFEGFKDNPYPYYYYSDTYILSSRWEGFPNSLLEALACGCKVVSTDCKSGPREILEDNEYGIIVPVDDYIQLANGILKSINGENKSGNRAEFFDISKIIKEYEKCLSKDGNPT